MSNTEWRNDRTTRHQNETFDNQHAFQKVQSATPVFQYYLHDWVAYSRTHLFFSQALTTAQVALSTELKSQNPMEGRSNSSTVFSCALVLWASLA